jgi:hypothetical protein
MEALNYFNITLNEFSNLLVGTKDRIDVLQNILSQLYEIIIMKRSRLQVIQMKNEKDEEMLKNMEEAIPYIQSLLFNAATNCFNTEKLIVNAKAVSENDDNPKAFNIAMAQIFASFSSLRSTICNTYKVALLLNKMSEEVISKLGPDSKLEKFLNQFTTMCKTLSEKLVDKSINSNVQGWVLNAMISVSK